ncbi:hypothetical protein [Algoriphagus taiwanensis]|uniref:Outer membrane protein beta-barrel domain-containing protein n=1 Tax=Algoriphagus taiwanensis TaxID=1445656 RepID=A0ABQ6Q0U1_9BACT|nr:hypothetical protein Ataiwa_17530 [Algoriphagus taiwanensis]
MKKIGFLFLLLIISFAAIAQTGLSVQGYYGISRSGLTRKVELVGVSTPSMDRVSNFGLILSKDLGSKFRVGTGLSYTYGTVDYSVNCPNCITQGPGFLVAHNPDFSMLSVPVYGEFIFGRIFYLAAGPLLDFQQSEGNNFSDQSGLGYLLGLGTRVPMKNWFLSFQSQYKRHGVVPFENQENNKFIFQELGLQIGIGYSF